MRRFSRVLPCSRLFSLLLLLSLFLHPLSSHLHLHRQEHQELFRRQPSLLFYLLLLSQLPASSSNAPPLGSFAHLIAMLYIYIYMVFLFLPPKVKVNAYLEQELGFRNTMRLQDGINGYFRYIKEQQQQLVPPAIGGNGSPDGGSEKDSKCVGGSGSSEPSEPCAGRSIRSTWTGANFVFDKRTLVDGDHAGRIDA